MAEKHVHKVYGSFPPWGKSVEFPASGGGGGNLLYGPYHRWGAEPSGFATLAKLVKGDDSISIIGIADAISLTRDAPEYFAITSIAVDPTLKTLNYFDVNSGVMSSGDILAELGITHGLMTETEFYDDRPSIWVLLDQVGLKGDGDDDRLCHYEKGMRWDEWTNSEFNTIGLVINDKNQVSYPPIEGRGEFILKQLGDIQPIIAGSDIIKGIYGYYIQEQV